LFILTMLPVAPALRDPRIASARPDGATHRKSRQGVFVMNKHITAFLAAATLAFGLAGTAVAAAPVNINKASAEEIADSLSGVGIKKAREIVSFRDKHGPFKSAEQLEDVKGHRREDGREESSANIRLQ
jgi:competence ComEA-like helix-hairpin-helix protein